MTMLKIIVYEKTIQCEGDEFIFMWAVYSIYLLLLRAYVPILNI